MLCYVMLYLQKVKFSNVLWQKKINEDLVSESGTTSYLEQRINWRGPKKTNHKKDSRKFGFGIKEAYTSVCLFVCLFFKEGEAWNSDCHYHHCGYRYHCHCHCHRHCHRHCHCHRYCHIHSPKVMIAIFQVKTP